jgi:flagellar biosynthesis protein FlhB
MSKPFEGNQSSSIVRLIEDLCVNLAITSLSQLGISEFNPIRIQFLKTSISNLWTRLLFENQNFKEYEKIILTFFFICCLMTISKQIFNCLKSSFRKRPERVQSNAVFFVSASQIG